MSGFDLGTVVGSLTQRKEETKENGGNAGLIGGLITVVLFIVVIGIFSFQAWRAGKERAKLLHEKAVREEEARRLQVDAQLAENAEDAIELLDKVEALQLEAYNLEQSAIAEANRHGVAIMNIQSATSWDQIDHLLDRKDPGSPLK